MTKVCTVFVRLSVVCGGDSSSEVWQPFVALDHQLQSLVKFLDRSGAVSDTVCSLTVGCAMHTAYAVCNCGVCRLQTASAAGLLQYCKGIQVEPQVCRSQQLLLGLATVTNIH